MDDACARQLLRGLECCDLNQFGHLEHVQVAWLLLRERGLLATLSFLPQRLRAFAVSRGQPQIYHETVTVAFLILVYERLVDGGTHLMWSEFCGRYPELLQRDLLHSYYPRELLQSDRAKQAFVVPPSL